MQEQFMKVAIDEARKGMNNNLGGPFGAVIVRDNQIIATGCNQVTSHSDPTAHAEVTAIRAACSKIKDFSLRGYELYTSCEPCPMCLGAIFWSRIDRIYFAATRHDAAEINFDDHLFYQEIAKDLDKRQVPMLQFMQEEALQVFEEWSKKINKINY